LTTISAISAIERNSWSGGDAASRDDEPARLLESGAVIFFPRLAFEIERHEAELFSPAILSSAKNASFDPVTARAGGTTLDGDRLRRLRDLMARFSDRAATLARALLPAYDPHLARARASFRPAEIAGRATSWRKDDTRLHVDSFPATPVQGRRILRLFSNVNPAGRPRRWRVGDRFEPVATRFAGALALPWPGSGALWHLLRVTKSRRSAYDALMLQLHDRMKGDVDFQERSPQTSFDFPAGTTWMAFTDQVPHAAMAGQYQLEQTFLLPVAAMMDESRSPLRILERLKGRSLA
jgi:hypothetical protein